MTILIILFRGKEKSVSFLGKKKRDIAIKKATAVLRNILKISFPFFEKLFMLSNMK